MHLVFVGDNLADAELTATQSAAGDIDAPGGTIRPRRRAADRSTAVSDGDAGTGAAQHLIARRRILDEALAALDRTTPSDGRLYAPPIPAVLLVIQSDAVRERFTKLLTMANLEIDAARDDSEALRRLNERVHALMFTDDVAVIAKARQLAFGAATHIVFVSDDAEKHPLEALHAGANDWVMSNARGERFWAHLTIARRIADLAASLQQALRDNRVLATVDELTGAGRRHFFSEQFPREVERAIRLHHSLSVILCDIDHFKRINDEHGHHAGDQVLREFCARLTGKLRIGRDWIARLGGEEFAIVLPEASVAKAWAVANRLRESVRTVPFMVESAALTVTASFGLCALDQVAPCGRSGAELMVRAADAALYRSKHLGRDRVTSAPAAADSQRTASPGSA